MQNKQQKNATESISGQISVLIRGFPPNTDLEEIRQYLTSICQDGTFKMSKKKCQFHGYAFLYFKQFEEAREFSKKKFYFKNTLLECKFPVDRDRYIKQCINDLKYPRKVFVDKIPKSYRNNDIKCVFSGFGKVQSVILIESNEKPINQAMVTFEEYEAAYKSVMKHIINTRDGANITVFYAQPKFSEYMLLSVDSRLRSYIREVQKHKRPFNPEEIRLFWDGKLVETSNNKKSGGGLLKGQNKNLNFQSSREEKIDSNNYNENFYNANDFEFPGLNCQFNVELDQVLKKENQPKFQNLTSNYKKNSNSSKNTLVSQKNRRKSSNTSKDGSQNLEQQHLSNDNVNQNLQGENLIETHPTLDLHNQKDSANQKIKISKSLMVLLKSDTNSSHNRSQSGPTLSSAHNLSDDLYKTHSVENKLIGGNHQTNTDYNEQIVPKKLTVDSNPSNICQKLERVDQNLCKTQKNCKKIYSKSKKQQKMNKQAYEREANGNHYEFSWEDSQQNMQQSQYSNGDQQYKWPYQNDYNQNGYYQTTYDQSYMSSNDTRQNDQYYSSQQNNQYAENTYAQFNQYEQNQACWDGTYYNTQQEYYHCYQETHTNYESSYDYQPYHAKTTYNDYYQNGNLNYECPNTQTNNQDNMYDWKNYSNGDVDYKQSNLRNEGFYYNVDPYHQDQKDFAYQSPENEQYYSLEQKYDCKN